jgi:hypothetical protein
MLALEMGGKPRDVRLDVLPDACPILRVHAIEPFVRPGSDLVVLVSDDRLPSCRVVDLVVPQLPVPQAIIGAGGRQRVSLLALTETLFGLSPQQLCPDAGQCDRKIDRFGDVVVRSELERRDDVFALVLGRHHQHRQVSGGRVLADHLEHFESAHFRHLHV